MKLQRNPSSTPIETDRCADRLSYRGVQHDGRSARPARAVQDSDRVYRGTAYQPSRTPPAEPGSPNRGMVYRGVSHSGY